jgi:MYXO-CTERM domain-containing protein
MTRPAAFLFLMAFIAAPCAHAQSARASWNAVTLDINGLPESISGYHIYYGTSQGGPYSQGFSTGDVLQTQVDDLQNNQTYYFVVTAVDQAGNESGYSNEDSYTVPLEDCNNLADDDHDGLTDCQDTECPDASEVCDGFDNDCDGTADNNLNAPACPLQDGVCAGSSQPCGGASGWQACSGSTYGADYQAQETLCDGLDNDCDGATDEDLSSPNCPLQNGVCAGARMPCNGVSGWGACGAAEYGADYQADETSCDNLDNDCDGSTDEDCPCTPNDSRPCSSDIGECSAGVQLCDANGQWGACSGKLPEDEACDGLDNDCDGTTDNHLDAPACALQEGVCADSRQPCGGQAGFLACDASSYGADYQSNETICDGLDNDCDGLTDEDQVCQTTDGGSDGGSDAGGDTGSDAGADSGSDAGQGESDSSITVIGGCQCGSETSGSSGLWLMGLLLVFTFRRRG